MAKFWNYFFGKESDKNRVVKDDAGEEPEDKMSNLEFIAHYKDLLKEYDEKQTQDTYLQDLREETPELLEKIKSMKQSEQLRRAEHPEEYDASGKYIGRPPIVPFNAPPSPSQNPFAGIGHKVGDPPRFSPNDPALGPL